MKQVLLITLLIYTFAPIQAMEGTNSAQPEGVTHTAYTVATQFLTFLTPEPKPVTMLETIGGTISVTGIVVAGTSYAGLKAYESYYNYQANKTVKRLVKEKEQMYSIFYRHLPNETIALINSFNSPHKSPEVQEYKKKAQLVHNPHHDEFDEKMPQLCKTLNTGVAVGGLIAITGGGILHIGSKIK